MKEAYTVTHTPLTRHTNILVTEVKEHLSNKYSNHQVYTDGSVLDSGQSGVGFVIPDLDIKQDGHSRTKDAFLPNNQSIGQLSERLLK